MGMLDRYRKPGGFAQLLSLIETCGPQKQEKFLEIVRTEDARWADAVRVKMLDMHRIYNWNDETLAEIVGTLQDLTLGIALTAAPENVRERINKLLTHARKRKIDDLMSGKAPTPGELATMHIKIIETVRKMAHDGFIRFDKVDPQLYMDDKFEESLLKPGSGHSSSSSAASAGVSTSALDFKIEYETPQPGSSSGEVDANAVAELGSLRKKLADLSKENAVLRHELSVAKNKLDQIKKIA
jgi:FliG C-terminal domain